MNLVDVSIIIVNWNTSDLLEGCLRSLEKAAQRYSVEIVVVDNASTDGSVEMIRDQYPQVQLIQNETNVGFARANNQGMQLSGGRYVFLLNSDTYVEPEAVDKLIEFADAYPKGGIIGSKLVNSDGSLQKSWAAFPSFWSELAGRNIRHWSRLETAEWDAYEVDWVGGAALLLRRALIEQIGGLDEDIFMYTEETDLCFRAKQARWSVYYLADSVITHLGGGSTNRASLGQLRRLYDSKIYFFHKHYGQGAALRLRLGLVCANFYGLVRRGVHVVFAPDREAIARVRTQWQLVTYLVTHR